MFESPVQVLLADDDDDDRNFFSEALATIKIPNLLTTVNDGEQLMNHLHQLLAAAIPKLPHIVFLDLNMPGKSGIECLEEIRSNPGLRDLTVAIYSTSASESDIEDTFVKGANVYIQKPTEFSALRQIMNDIININWQYQNSGLNRDTFLLNY